MDRREFIAMSPAFPLAATTATLTVKAEGREPVDLDVSVLRLQPGDTIVMSAPDHIRLETADRIRCLVEAKFPGVQAMVLSGDMKVEGVLRGPSRSA